jgi:hypothetical protein
MVAKRCVEHRIPYEERKNVGPFIDFWSLPCDQSLVLTSEIGTDMSIYCDKYTRLIGSLSPPTSPLMTIRNTSSCSISVNLRPRRVGYPSFHYGFFPVTSSPLLLSKCTIHFLLLTVEPYLPQFCWWDLSGPLFCVHSQYRKEHVFNVGTKVGYSDWYFHPFLGALQSPSKKSKARPIQATKGLERE